MSAICSLHDMVEMVPPSPFQFNLLDSTSHSEPSPTSLTSVLPYLSKLPLVLSDMLHIADLHFPIQQSVLEFSCLDPKKRQNNRRFIRQNRDES